MPKLTLNLKRKHAYLIASIIVFILGVGIVIAASTWSDATHPVSHSADDIKVNVGGDYHSLQSAITNGLLGGIQPITCESGKAIVQIKSDGEAVCGQDPNIIHKTCDVSSSGSPYECYMFCPSSDYYIQNLQVSESSGLARCCDRSESGTNPPQATVKVHPGCGGVAVKICKGSMDCVKL